MRPISPITTSTMLVYERVGADETVKVEFEEHPEALYFWTVLQSLFDLSLRTILLRTTDPPSGTREEQRTSDGKTSKVATAAVGLDPERLMRKCRYGAGWSAGIER